MKEFRKLTKDEIPKEWNGEMVAFHYVGSHGLCAIYPLLFTWGFMTELELDGLSYSGNRYCFPKDDHSNLIHILSLLKSGWPEGEHPPGNWVKYKGSKYPESSKEELIK